ncbi:MAG: DUF2244 domain-containing protein [Pseudomonadota bacterium]
MLETAHCRETGTETIRVSPNRSMSGRTLAIVFALIASGCLLFSLLLAFQGYWVPLPFAGAEVLALGLALLWVRRELRTTEEIAVSDGELRVRHIGRLGRREAHFHPAWVRIELRRGRYRWYPRRLVITSHGRELEIGAFLAEPERHALATQLRELLRPHAYQAG